MRTAVVVLLLAIATSISAQEARKSGVDLSAIDASCKPCEDFWRYANGTWLGATDIPASRAAWGPSQILTSTNRGRLRTLLEAAAADRSAPAPSETRKIGDYYASCMDTAAIDRRGLSPLEPDFQRVAAIQSRRDLGEALIAFQRTGRPFGEVNGVVVGPFRVTSGQDAKDPTRVIARIVERDAAGRTATSILSLPDRDYYVKEDAASKATREAFIVHVVRLLELAGTPHARAEHDAGVVMTFETALARAALSIAERRDPDRTYHPMDVAGLRALAPAFDWPRLLAELGLPASTMVNVGEPDLLKAVNQQLEATPIDDWKTWLHWRVLKIAAPYLTTLIAAEDFRFDRAVLTGVTEPLPRWETCVTMVDRDLTDALAAAYVGKYFPPAAKARVARLVENLRNAMRGQLEQSPWMQPETKRRAIEKLSALRVEIGYPAKWHSFASVAVARDRYFENVRAAWTAGQRREIARVGKPLDRSEWAMSPPTVNAYSNSGQVVIVFPAGILQPPYFDPEADDAANYGAIGAVIGHEMGHQFDDGGSKFDATGKLENWWTEADRKTFDARAACVETQFNTLDVGNGLHHNGKQVLGEALGDLGGLRTAYVAYHRSLAGGSEPPSIDGFTADQRFFLAYARVWGTKMRDEQVRLQLNTNNHPLPEFRAIGTLQNMPEFHRAFGCKEGDRMVRPTAQQCSLW